VNSNDLKLPIATAFYLQRGRGAQILHQDLKGAGIAIENDMGKLDFHSLRHTCATRMARSGVSQQECMKIMRHSDLKVTMDFIPTSHLRTLEKQFRKFLK